MTTPEQAREMAGSVSAKARDAILSIHPDFKLGERFRLDEGQHHAPFTALTGLGILSRERIGGHYTVYALTPLGLQVRAILQEQGK